MKKEKRRHGSLGTRGVRRKGSAGEKRADWAAPSEELYRPIKKPVTLRLDADILSWFKTQGRGYQTRINRALRSVMMRERKDG